MSKPTDHCQLYDCTLVRFKSIPFLIIVDTKVEAKVVVQALRLNTLSKLTFADLKRFDGLVRDTFPNVEFQDVDYEKLADAVRESAQELNLVIMPTQVSLHAIVVSRASNTKSLIIAVYVH